MLIYFQTSKFCIRILQLVRPFKTVRSSQGRIVESRKQRLDEEKYLEESRSLLLKSSADFKEKERAAKGTCLFSFSPVLCLVPGELTYGSLAYTHDISLCGYLCAFNYPSFPLTAGPKFNKYYASPFGSVLSLTHGYDFALGLCMSSSCRSYVGK